MPQSLSQFDWAWTLTGWTLCAAASILLLWGIFWDRPRGRNRCPKCWYDMVGAVARVVDTREEFTCPECGRIARGVRQLRRTRRTWRLIPLALLAFIASYGAFRAPAILQHGWMRAIPSTYLALRARADLRDPMSSQRFGFAPRTPARPTFASSSPFDDALSDEAWRRITENDNWAWQTRLFVGRAVRARVGDLKSFVYLPPRWVVDEPVTALVSTANSNRFWSFKLAFDDAKWRSIPEYPSHKSPVGTFASTGVRTIDVPVVLLMGQTVIYREQVPKRVEIRENHRDILEPAHIWSSQDETLGALLNARLSIDVEGRVGISVASGRDAGARPENLMHVGCVGEIRQDGVVLGTTRFTVARSRHPVFPRSELEVQWNQGGEAAAASQPEHVQFLMRGDPDVAWDSFIPFQYTESHPTYWAGSVEVHPTVTRDH